MLTYKQFVGCGLMIALSIGWMGCGSSSSSGGSAGGGTSMDAMARQIDAQNAARKQQETAAATKATADQNAVAAQPPAEPERKAVGRRAAVAGGGYYGAIMGARRHVMNVVDNLSWIQGVRSFKAEEGRKPKDNDEFMNVVVKKYELQLPRIEEDEEYVYDPNGESDGDFGQLYVVKKEPAKQ